MTSRGHKRRDTYAHVLRVFRKLIKERLACRRPDRRTEISQELRALVERKITVDEYLSVKMDRAMEPLRHLLHEDELAHVRACLGEHVRSHPMWLRIIGQLRMLVEPCE